MVSALSFFAGCGETDARGWLLLRLIARRRILRVEAYGHPEHGQRRPKKAAATDHVITRPTQLKGGARHRTIMLVYMSAGPVLGRLR